MVSRVPELPSSYFILARIHRFLRFAAESESGGVRDRIRPRCHREKEEGIFPLSSFASGASFPFPGGKRQMPGLINRVSRESEAAVGVFQALLSRDSCHESVEQAAVVGGSGQLSQGRHSTLLFKSV